MTKHLYMNDTVLLNFMTIIMFVVCDMLESMARYPVPKISH